MKLEKSKTSRIVENSSIMCGYCLKVVYVGLAYMELLKQNREMPFSCFRCNRSSIVRGIKDGDQV